MRRIVTIIFCFTVTCLWGCGDGALSIVQGGVLHGHTATTVDKALSGSFTEATWSVRETGKGETIVEFTGRVNKSTHDAIVRPLVAQLDTDPFSRVHITSALVDAGACGRLDPEGKVAREALRSVAPFEGNGGYIKQCFERFVMPINSMVRIEFAVNQGRRSFTVKQLEVDSSLPIPISDFWSAVYQ